MFESLERVDWSLLHRQKLILLEMRGRQPADSPEELALSGIIHLLDALQDDAANTGRWVFPGEPPAPTAKRYYVKDDDGHYHGPMTDYEEAAAVAEATHGRIITEEVGNG